jgi:DNA-binding NarL/FixJ family response regulator
MKGPVRIRLIVADERPIFLDGLQQSLSLERDLVVVGRCRDGGETLRAVQQHSADVLLINARIPGNENQAVLRELSDRRHSIAVVLLSADLPDDEIAEAVRLGARGVFLMDAASHLLAQCVRRVHMGDRWGEERWIKPVAEILCAREPLARGTSRRLTSREIEIVRKAGAGLRTRAIARELSVSEGTIKVHLQNIYAKLGVSGRFALMQWACETGLFTDNGNGNLL